MTKPVGSDSIKPLFVYDDTARNTLIDEAASLPSITVSSATAANAVAAGADILVVGRPILKSADPPAAADEIRLEMEQAHARKS